MIPSIYHKVVEKKFSPPLLHARLTQLPWVIQVLALYILIRLGVLILLTYSIWAQELDFHAILNQWDAQWFLSISQHGYRHISHSLHDSYHKLNEFTGYAFFPGFPYTFRYFIRFTHCDPTYGAIIYNGVFSALAAIAFYRITHYCARYLNYTTAQSHRAGLLGVTLFSTLPMSTVYFLMYSESMYLCFALWAMYYVINQRWIVAGILTACAGATRTSAVGIIALTMLSAIIAYVQTKKTAHTRNYRAVIGFLLAPLGWVTYLLWVAHRQGSLFAWFAIQKAGWSSHFDFGIGTIRYIYEQLIVGHEIGYILVIFFLGAGVLLSIASWKMHLPWQISFYSTATFLPIILSDGMMSSRPRLMIAACTLLIHLIFYLMQLNKKQYVIYLTSFLSFSVWFGIYMLAVFPDAI